MKAGSLSLSVRAADIPADGRRFVIEASEAERRALAEELGIPEVTELTADIHVRPLGRRAFSLLGTLAASVVQTDVVTLEPLRQAVEETIDVLVAAEDAAPKTAAGSAEPDKGEGPDFLRNGRIALGALTAEHLALGLDPYPRAPGVEFAGHIEDDSPDGAPLAALAKLKKAEE